MHVHVVPVRAYLLKLDAQNSIETRFAELKKTNFLRYYHTITRTTFKEVNSGYAPVPKSVVLKLVNGEEALFLGSGELLFSEGLVVVVRINLTKRPDESHLSILNVMVSSSITWE